MATTTVKNNSPLSGKEREVNYKILPLPANQGRFAFTYNVFKARLGRLIFTNLLMLICLTPLVAVYVLRYLSVDAGLSLGWLGNFLGIVYVGSGNVGVGYPVADPSLAGVAEMAVLHSDFIFGILAIVSSLATALAVAGGMYCTRKFIRSDDDFHIKDFFTGIHHNYFSALIGTAVSFLVVLGCVVFWDYCMYRIAIGGSVAGWYIFAIAMWVVGAVLINVCLWYVAVASGYRLPVAQSLRHGIVFSFKTILQTILCLVIGVLPLALFFFGSIFSTLAGAWYLILGLSTEMLIFASLSDWAFDASANYTKVQTEQQAKAEALIASHGETYTEEEKMNMLLVGGKSCYLAKAIMPFAQGEKVMLANLPFSKEQLESIAENKKALRAEAEKFAKEHETEEKYVTYNRLFDNREQAIGGTKKKKLSSASLLG